MLRNWKSYIIYIVLATLVIADGVITNYLINSGLAYESNGFISSYAGTNKLLLLKIVGVISAILILYKISLKHKKLAQYTTLSFSVIYGLIVIWNISILRFM
jgi:hypothetical protein